MTLFLPAGLLLESLLDAVRIGEYLRYELALADRWGQPIDRERLTELRQAVDRLIAGCGRAQALAQHLHCDPLVYTGTRSTEQVLSLLDRLWTVDDRDQSVDPDVES